MVTAYLRKSPNTDKKYAVTIIFDNVKQAHKLTNNMVSSRHTVHFGANGYSDYTKHKDPDRMRLYLARHAPGQDWTKHGIITAGFWSRWILWNQPGFIASIKDVERRFGINIIRSAPPA